MTGLRIMCFNIHGGRSMDGQRDLARVHSLMERFNIDIAVLQEMETRASRGGTPQDVDIVAGATRPHRVIGASITHPDGWYGNLIASRYPVVRSLIHNLETANCYEPRLAVDALVETPLGKLRIIGTHLSLSPFQRWSEARNLMRLIEKVEDTEKHPVLLMGDINEWRPFTRLIRYLDRSMVPLPAGRSFPSRLPVFRLDRAWCDAPHITARAHVLKSRETRVLSDHLPLVLDIEIPRAA